MQPAFDKMAKDGASVPPFFAGTALILGNVALALGPLLVRFSDAGPISTGFWRVILPMPLLFLLGYRSGFRWSAVPRNVIWMAGLAGAFFALDISSWHLGIYRTKLSNATLFGNFASLMLIIYAIFLLRRLPGRWQSLAILLAIGGSALLMGQSLELSPRNFLGDLLSLAAGILYCGYLLAMMRARSKLDNWSALAISSLVCAPLMLVIALLSGEQFWPDSWWPLFALAFTSQLIGQGFLTYALGHFTPLVIGLALLLQPAVAAASGWYFFGEALSLLDWTGSVMVMTALVLVRLPERS